MVALKGGCLLRSSHPPYTSLETFYSRQQKDIALPVYRNTTHFITSRWQRIPISFMLTKPSWIHHINDVIHDEGPTTSIFVPS